MEPAGLNPDILLDIHKLKFFVNDDALPECAFALYEEYQDKQLNLLDLIPFLEAYTPLYQERLNYWKSRYLLSLKDYISDQDEAFIAACAYRVSQIDSIVDFFEFDIPILYEYKEKENWRSAGADSLLPFLEKVILEAQVPELFEKVLHQYPVKNFAPEVVFISTEDNPSNGRWDFCYTSLSSILYFLVKK